MKNKVFFIAAIIPILLSPFITMTTLLGLANSSGKIIGSISMPLFELPFIIIYIVIIKLIWKFNFGFKLKKKMFPLVVIIPVIVMVILNIFTSKSLNVIFKELPSGQTILAAVISLLAALVIGIFEETVFRGILFNYLSFLFRKTNYPLLFSGLGSSFFFGIVHLSNAIIGGAKLGYTLYQVLYAIAIGFTFAMLYAKTGSLIGPIILHAIIDWSDLFFNLAGEPSISGINWSIIIIIIMFAISGYLLYRTTQADSVKNLGFEAK
ncbi:CPBP family intramembrane glutamic endopeptidase [Liquorilactobacillus hordei]|uniref:CAAX prenyl protease 2/Lysostaphin resistance protein A-like domain-containing protein n=1 Tax=Liquorilactobacillus hordei TaxID=468911 RepID=A0A3Q8C9E6_9LACO|nr:type II CAAX endopeptidase family protein [Liquorilactobacillus hordei]AUJ29732.1 hypothetical protein BSQ49_05705 [Liquorilactobacillus hordei]